MIICENFRAILSIRPQVIIYVTGLLRKALENCEVVDGQRGEKFYRDIEFVRMKKRKRSGKMVVRAVLKVLAMCNVWARRGYDVGTNVKNKRQNVRLKIVRNY